MVMKRKPRERRSAGATPEEKVERPVVSPLGQVFTSAQVAQMLQISLATVQRAIRAGKLKAHRVGRVYRLNEADMRAWWETLSTTSTEGTRDG
jgi:excisionase family DNA binding protein